MKAEVKVEQEGKAEEVEQEVKAEERRRGKRRMRVQDVNEEVKEEDDEEDEVKEQEEETTVSAKRWQQVAAGDFGTAGDSRWQQEEETKRCAGQQVNFGF